MGELHEMLVDKYAEHYERVNRGCLTLQSDRMHKGMQANYGDLLAGLPKGSRVLDLGCGTGFLLDWMARQPNIVPVGTDASASQLDIARKNLPGVELHCADGLRHLRAHAGEYAGIFCLDVLEHIPTEDLCYQWVVAAANALQPGGFFLCRTPNAANLLASYSRYMDLTHVRCLTRTSMLQLLEAAGFDRCEILPLRSASLKGKVRLSAERLLHRVVFKVCGHNPEPIVTSNVMGLAIKAAA